MALTPNNTLLRQIQLLAAGSGVCPWSDHQLLDAFAERRDQGAFAALVGRHGPMVLRVCRRILGHEQDAEDAFQATFLVLAQMSTRIRKRHAVAGWLHGVAYRTAMKIKRSAARRRSHEARQAAGRPQSQSPRWDDVQVILDEEIARLPHPYRTAFVLCILEGKTSAEAAAALDVKLGTVLSRVARARRLLQRRLARRGIEFTSVLAALSITDCAAPSGVPAALAHVTIHFGVLVASGQPTTGIIPSHIAALAAGVIKAMFLTKAKTAMAVLLAAGLLVAGAGKLAHHALAAKETPPSKAAANAASAGAADGEEKGDSIEVSGRVVDPDGTPFAGAQVFFVRSILALRQDPSPAPAVVASDREGRFRLRISRTGYGSVEEKTHWLHGAVVAIGQGFAAGWVGGADAENLATVTIRLAKEVPIDGRVVDLQGKPVAGVRLQVRTVSFRADGGTLGEFAEALGKQGSQFSNRPLGLLQIDAGQGPDTRLEATQLGLTQPAVTDADGRFRLTGIRGECLVGLRLEGATIETAEMYALTRPIPAVTQQTNGIPIAASLIFPGRQFNYVAGPAQPIEGVVRDVDTGMPLAGVTIKALIPSALLHTDSDRCLCATTDAQGRYRLAGLSSRNEVRRTLGVYGPDPYHMRALAPPGAPYMNASKIRQASPGLDAVKVNFDLKRGVRIRGHVTDKAAGRPVAAVVEWFAFRGNPHLSEKFSYDHAATRTAQDGSFTVVGLPGPGLLTAKAADGQDGRFLLAVGAEGVAEQHRLRFPSTPGGLQEVLATHPFYCNPSAFNTLVEINPAQDVDSVEQDLVLDPGKTVVGSIVDPNDRPAKGVSVEQVPGGGFHEMELPSAAFRIPGGDPKQPRWFLFRHLDRNLGTSVLLKGDEPMPVTIRLQKCGRIMGRLLDEQGQPHSGLIVGYICQGQLNITVQEMLVFKEPAPDDGRFHIDGVIPGLKLRLFARSDRNGLSTEVPALNDGEVRNLGDLRLKERIPR